MKFFFRRKDDTSLRKPHREYSISLTERDYCLLYDNDVTLKIRLSEQTERMIDEVCSYLDTTVSDFIRQVLFVHLYGRYDLLGLIERRFPVLDEQRRHMVITAAPDEPSAGRERNVADIKIYLPQVMKDDLTFLAGSEKTPLSRYVRNVVTTHLSGHAALADSPVNRTLGGRDGKK